MRPLGAGALALAVLCGSVSGCSSDPTQDYCDELGSVTDRLVALAERSGDPGDDYLEPALELFEQLRSQAPDDLRDEWDTFVFAWQDLVEVLGETGVDPTTFDPTKRPEGLSQQDFDRIRAVGSELRSGRVRDAADGITRHANDVCGLTLDL